MQGHCIQTFLECVQDDLKKKKLDPRGRKLQKHNLSKEENRALKLLKDNTEIVICLADKGVVIQNYSDYNSEARKILSDQEYYQMKKKK